MRGSGIIVAFSISLHGYPRILETNTSFEEMKIRFEETKIRFEETKTSFKLALSLKLQLNLF